MPRKHIRDLQRRRKLPLARLTEDVRLDRALQAAGVEDKPVKEAVKKMGAGA